MTEENPFSGDKTEEPTPHRRREARRRGQAVKSTELNSAVNMLGLTALLYVLGDLIFRGNILLLSRYLGNLSRPFPDPASFSGMTREAFASYFQMISPVFLAAVFLGVGANIAQVGFLVTPRHLLPNFDRLNPVNGLKRIFSRRAIFEALKVLLKVALFGFVAFTHLRGRLGNLTELVNQDVAFVAVTFWDTVISLGLKIALAFLLIAIMDYVFQRFEFQKELRMTRREVKEEYKHLEGDPLLRAKIREKQRYFARQRMLNEVPAADVVITNPTRLAVALRYREGRDRAPVLLAKGAGQLAQRIREIADSNNVPIVENKEVAQILFKEVEIGKEIPVALYRAVAEILALIYRLRPLKGRDKGE